MLISKKVIKRILIIFTILLNLINIKALAVVSPTYKFYVNDYANLIDTDVENYIINTNNSLYTKTGAQIVVVTVQNLDGQAIEEYATELFRKFGIGDKTKNNGILMLLALDEREFRIEVGYGLEGCLPDGKTGRIQDEYIIPYLRQNNWNDGIKNGYNAILEVVKDEYNIEIDSESPQKTSEISGESYLGLLGFIAIPLLAGIIISHNKNKVKSSLIYMLISTTIIALIARNIGIIIVISIINFILLISGIKRIDIVINGHRIGGRRFYRRIFKQRLFWRRTIFWRRRFFWRRRKLKKILN